MGRSGGEGGNNTPPHLIKFGPGKFLTCTNESELFRTLPPRESSTRLRVERVQRRPSRVLGVPRLLGRARKEPEWLGVRYITEHARPF